MTSTSPRPAGKSKRTKLLLLIVMVPVALGLAELGARALAFTQGRPTSPTALKEELLLRASALVTDLPGAAQLDKLEVQARRRFQPHPFTAWDTSTSQQVSRELIDGYATGELNERYVVVVVGGSVAGIFASEKGGKREFERVLESDERFAGTDVVVISQGRGAWKQPQQLILFTYLLTRGVVPDLVLNLDGFNEVALTNHNHTLRADPIYPSMPQWTGLHLFDSDPRVREFRERSGELRRDTVEIAQRGSEGLRPYSLLWTELTLRELRRKANEAEQLRELLTGPGSVTDEQTSVRGQRIRADTETVIASGVDVWFRSSVALETLCSANDVAYFHVLQPTLHDPGAKVVTQEEERNGEIHYSWLAGVVEGYPMLRARGAELVAAGVPFRDSSRVFEGLDTTLYYDSCHFGQEGNEILARDMANAFLAQLPPGPAKRAH